MAAWCDFAAICPGLGCVRFPLSEFRAALRADAHLARLEATTAVAGMLGGLPGLRLDPGRPAPAPRGLIFRKPPALRVRWDNQPVPPPA